MQQPPPLPSVNPYAAPSARVDDAVSGDIELAERVTRLLAVIIDGLIFGGIVVLFAIAFAALNRNQSFQYVAMTLMVAAVIGLAAVNLTLLYRYGQTIGKRILNIKVVRVDGSRCALSRYIFARVLPVGLLGAIPLLGPLVSLIDPLMIFRNDQRCLHDLIADTIVIKA